MFFSLISGMIDRAYNLIKNFGNVSDNKVCKWTIYSATTFLEKCRKVVLEKWFSKLGSFFWLTTFLKPDFLNQISWTTFLKPLFYTYIEKWLQNKWSIVNSVLVKLPAQKAVSLISEQTLIEFLQYIIKHCRCNVHLLLHILVH